RRGSWSWVSHENPLRTLGAERDGDVVLVLGVFGQLLGALGRRRGDELVVVGSLGRGILTHVRRVAGQDEPEQMVRMLGENRVRLGVRDGLVPRYGGDAPDVVVLVEIQG